jgi:uncharacterized cupredoxin-like copper-binding protein
VRRIVTLLVAVAALAACSDGGGGREVHVELFEMGFEPARIEVAAGETVTFVVENAGFATHEFFVGDEADQQAREEELASGAMPSDPNSVIVANGGSAELTHTFGRAGELLMGCHIIGHYAAGMVGTIVVG